MKNNLLVYDLSSTQPLGSKYHGGGLYGEVLFIKLLKNIRKDVRVVVFYYKNRFISRRLIEICLESKIEMYDVTGDFFQDAIEELSPKLFFTPLPTKKRIIHNKGTLMLTVCHDLRTTEVVYDTFSYSLCKTPKDYLFLFDSIFFGGFFQKKNMMLTAKKYIGYDDIKFWVVSNHTKYQLINLFPKYLNNDVKVFYSPTLDQIDCDVKDISPLNFPSYIVPQAYFFMVSGSVWLKNILRACVALDQLFTAHPSFDKSVVICGLSSKKRILDRVKNKERFIVMDYVDRNTLDALHKHAYSFIYPSLGEGFGYSPLDSMKHSVPVLAAANSSIMEICGDAALFFNAKSIPEIKNRCLQFMDNEIYSSFKAKSFERYLHVKSKQDADIEKLVSYIQSFID